MRSALVATALVTLGATVGAAGLWLVLGERSAPVPHPQMVVAQRQPTKASAHVPAMVTLASEPSGAEVVVRGAVIGNTPMHVSRAAHEALYLLRHRGYHPQLVRVSAQSGERVVVALRPVAEELVAPEGQAEPKARTKTQHVSAKPRGNDVSKQ